MAGRVGTAVYTYLSDRFGHRKEVSMRILTMENDIKEMPSETRDDILRREARKAWQLQQESIIREIYLTDNRSKAVLILECGSLDEAEKRLGDLPLVKEGYVTFRLYRLDPYPGYSRLFV
jgi:hypothetical protein